MSSSDTDFLTTDLDGFLGYQIRRISSAAMGSLTDKLSAHGSRVAEYTVMFQIAEKPGITSSEIGRILDIKRANMTPLISSLVERGLVESTRKDGRSQALQLSPAGLRNFAQLSEVVKDFEENLASPLSVDELQTLQQLLKKVWRPIARERLADS